MATVECACKAGRKVPRYKTPNKGAKPIDWCTYMEALKAEFRSGAITRDEFERRRAVVKTQIAEALFSD